MTQRNEEAFNLYQQVKDNEKTRRKLFILNVVSLTEIYNKNLYKEILGEEVEPKWNGLLADLEIYYTRSKIERWRKIITKLVGELKIDPEKLIEIPETRLENIVSIYDKQDAEINDLLELAKNMIPIDWRNLVRSAQGKVTTDDCDHEFQEYQICKKCGFRVKK